MRSACQSRPQGCCLLLLLYTCVERHYAGSSWARYVGNVVRRGCLDCPAISRLSALLSVQLFLLWSLGAQNGWPRTDRLGPQTHTGSAQSQSTSAFCFLRSPGRSLAAETLDLRVLSGVYLLPSTGFQLSLREANGRVMPFLLIGPCVQVRHRMLGISSRVRNVSRDLRSIFTSGGLASQPIRYLGT